MHAGKHGDNDDDKKEGEKKNLDMNLEFLIQLDWLIGKPPSPSCFSLTRAYIIRLMLYLNSLHFFLTGECAVQAQSLKLA